MPRPTVRGESEFKLVLEFQVIPKSSWSADIASLDQDGKPLPGVAQVAMQQGRYVGNLIRRRFAGKNGQCPFRYFDKCNMALVGKGFAVLQSGKLRMSGFLAWLAWAAVHLEFLAQPGLRISVFVQWDWTFG
jgi:NADH:ubiquinone reductase (H+-translocating)